MNPENPTPEEIAKHYSAAMDSVSLINDINSFSKSSDQVSAGVALLGSLTQVKKAREPCRCHDASRDLIDMHVYEV